MGKASSPFFTKGTVFMLSAVFAFGLMNVLVKSIPRIPVHQVIFFRSAFTLLATGILLKKQKISPWGNNRKWLFIRGILGTLAITVFFFSLHHIPLASLATLQYMAPIFTAISGMYLLKEKVNRVQWLLLASAMVGVLLTRGLSADIPLLYYVLGLLSAVFSGIAYAVVRKLSKTDDPLVIIFWFPLIAAPISGILCLFRWQSPTMREWILLLAVGVLTQIAQMFLSWALKWENALRVTSTMFLGTLVAFGFSILLFKESYSWDNIAGIIIIILSVLGNIRLTGKH